MSETSSGSLLHCIAGPDSGKRLALSGDELVLGSADGSNLRSDDPEVPGRAAGLRLENGKLRVQALSKKLPIYVDGHPKDEALLEAGQQIRIGKSTWQFGPAQGTGLLQLLTGLGDRLSLAAGLDVTRDWNLAEMFSDVVKKHSDEEVENYFTVGTSRTTPALAEIDARWPKPWVFLRVLLLSLGLYLGFVWAWGQFENIKLVPAVIITGSFAIPLALLIFFFEVNVPRNISIYQVIKLLLLGGLLSIVVSLIFFRATRLSSWLGAASAGIIEETGKALTLLLVVAKPRYRWTLNGLLLGATIGTGFAVFESAGYALSVGVDVGGLAMRHNIVERGLLSLLGGHVLWTGLVGAALWRIKGDAPFHHELLWDKRFLRVFVLCVAMHMIWNAPFQLPAYGKYLILGAAAWLLVLGFIQVGLREVAAVQQKR